MTAFCQTVDEVAAGQGGKGVRVHDDELGCQKAPTMFLVSPRSTAVLPPMEESIIERVVVGQLMKSMPRI